MSHGSTEEAETWIHLRQVGYFVDDQSCERSFRGNGAIRFTFNRHKGQIAEIAEGNGVTDR